MAENFSLPPESEFLSPPPPELRPGDWVKLDYPHHPGIYEILRIDDEGVATLQKRFDL